MKKNKIDPSKIKMVKMPDTPYMREMNQKMWNAKTPAERDAILQQMGEYMKKMGLAPDA